MGGLLAFNGFASLPGLLAKSRLLELPDPLLGVPFRYLGLFVAASELLVAALFLFTRRRVLSLTLGAWLAANMLVYRLGLCGMGWTHPYGWLQGLMNSLNTSPRRADFVSYATIGLLLLGSLAILWSQCRRRAGLPPSHAKGVISQPVMAKPAAADPGAAAYVRFLKISCAACGGHIEFPTNFFGDQIPCPHCRAIITLQKPLNLKMTCPACKGHVEFPDYALGQQIPCPHCQKEITLEKTES